MADPFATVGDYVDRTGKTLTPVQQTQVKALLADASALIRSRLKRAGAPPGFQPDADMARAVAVAVVVRRMANPGGLRSRMVGGWQESYGEDGGLYVTDDELDSLMPDESDEPQAYTLVARDAGFGEGAALYPHHRHFHHHPPGYWW